ncbi:MAG: hypothetical protein IIC90_03360 [Chloroflexi bacterium]|nr:hypothetical protein [Chloroflexota bacterium]
MPTWPDCWGTNIRITEERLSHVLEHPEMADEERRIAETLAQPDIVVQSASDPEVRLYHRLYETATVGAKHLCAVVKWRDEDAFLVTAYFTDRPKRGAVLWTNR